MVKNWNFYIALFVKAFYRPTTSNYQKRSRVLSVVLYRWVLLAAVHLGLPLHLALQSSMLTRNCKDNRNGDVVLLHQHARHCLTPKVKSCRPTKTDLVFQIRFIMYYGWCCSQSRKHCSAWTAWTFHLFNLLIPITQFLNLQQSRIVAE